MGTLLTDPSIVINNEAIFIAPNTVAYMEGFGEGTVVNQSAGNGVIDQLESDDVSTQIGMIKFSVYSTVENINLARSLKANRNQNAITLTATTPDGQTLTRNFAQMKLTSDYEVNLQSDGVIELEFKGRRATV